MTARGRTSQQARAYAGLAAVPGAVHHLQALLAAQADLQLESALKRVVLVHVLGEEFAEQASRVCQQAGIPLTLVKSSQQAYGIQVAYPNPAHLGADRWVGLLAARSLAAGKAAIIIDCGTAVTVDALQADGVHRGGLILPGLRLLADALARRTQAKHMAESLFSNPQIFTNNTAQAMGSGCLFGLVGAIEGICARMQAELREPVQVIICGGDAELLHTHLQLEHILSPDALMEGLQYIAEQEACTSC